MAVVCLGALTLIFGCAVFLKGGVEPDQWFLCVAAIGLTGAGFWIVTRRSDLAPPPSFCLRFLLAAFAGYCVFTLLPLPLEFVRLLSPVRAELQDALEPVLGPIPRAPLSAVPAETLRFTITVLAYIVVFLLVRELAGRWRERPWIVVIPFLAVALLQAALGLVQYHAAGVAVSTGTYVNRNHFSGLVEMALPFAVMLGVAAVRRERVVSRSRSPAAPAIEACIWLALATVLLLAILDSMSRMGFVAALASFFVMGAVALGGRWRGARRWMPVGAVGCLVVAGFVFLPTDRLIERFAHIAGTEEITGDTRFQIWENTKALVADYPVVGCGLGGYASVFHGYQEVAPMSLVDFAHNDYLQLLAELGLLGFPILLLLAVRTFGRAFAAADLPAGDDSRYVGIACVGSLTAIALHSVVDFNLYIPANAMLFVWVAGLAEGLGMSAPSRHRRKRSMPAYVDGAAVRLGPVSSG